MAHPVSSSARSLDFYGNLSDNFRGASLTFPPNNETYWKAKGAGTYIGWEWTVFNGGTTEVDESGMPVGNIYWDPVTLGLENGPEPLFGFKVSTRAYQDVITETPPPVDEDGNPIGDPVFANTRTYPPQTGVTCKFINSQTRIPPLWPRPAGLEGPGQAEWIDATNVPFSTIVVPRRFEGVTLYDADQEVSDGNNPIIVGIAEGEARCVGFVENKDVLEVNFMPPGDYYVTLDTLVGYMRTPNDRIEPLVNNNEDDPIGKMIPTLGPIAGRITYPEELPRSTPQNPIPIGTTYVQQEVPNGNFVIPFPGFVGRHLWVFVDEDSTNFAGEPIRDQNGNVIEDFRWMRTQRPEQVSGYNYVLVFDESKFEYILRMSGPTTEEIFILNPAITGGWFPTEPYEENANPPLYPYDSIPTFVPDERETIDVYYKIEVSGSSAPAESIVVVQTCIAPTRNWGKMLTALLGRSYYFNGMSRSYAAEPGYCNPSSPNFGDNQQDPYCIATGQS